MPIQNSGLPIQPSSLMKSTLDIWVLKAQGTRLIWLNSDGPNVLQAITRVKRTLGTWYANIPRLALLESSVSNPEHPVQDTVYFIHLLHLDTLMFTYRQALQAFRDAERRERLRAQERVDLNVTLDDGLIAAEQSARLLTLLVRSPHELSYCWTAMYVLCLSHRSRICADGIISFQAYVCGSVLLYNAMQLKLHGRAAKSWKTSLDLTQKALSVLHMCESLAPIAVRFANTMEQYLSAFESAPEAHLRRGLSADMYSRAATMSPSQQQPSHFLFVRPADGDPELQSAAEDLFEMLCRSLHRPGAPASWAPELDNVQKMHRDAQGVVHFPWQLPSSYYTMGTAHIAEQILSHLAKPGARSA